MEDCSSQWWCGHTMKYDTEPFKFGILKSKTIEYQQFDITHLLLLFSSLKERSPCICKERHPQTMFNLIEKQITKGYTLYLISFILFPRNKYAQKYMENFRMRWGNKGN